MGVISLVLIDLIRGRSAIPFISFLFSLPRSDRRASRRRYQAKPEDDDVDCSHCPAYCLTVYAVCSRVGGSWHVLSASRQMLGTQARDSLGGLGLKAALGWPCVSVQHSFPGGQCTAEKEQAVLNLWMFSSVRHGMACRRTWGIARRPLPPPMCGRGRRSVTASFLTGLANATRAGRRGRSGKTFDFLLLQRIEEMAVFFPSREIHSDQKMGSSAPSTTQSGAWAPNPMAL